MGYLLPIGWGRLAKLVRVRKDGIVLGVDVLQTGTLSLARRISGRAKVFEAGSQGPLMELGRGGSEERGENERPELHLGLLQLQIEWQEQVYSSFGPEHGFDWENESNLYIRPGLAFLKIAG